jgi:hypothetical protein
MVEITLEEGAGGGRRQVGRLADERVLVERGTQIDLRGRHGQTHVTGHHLLVQLVHPDGSSGVTGVTPEDRRPGAQPPKAETAAQ